MLLGFIDQVGHLSDYRKKNSLSFCSLRNDPCGPGQWARGKPMRLDGGLEFRFTWDVTTAGHGAGLLSVFMVLNVRRKKALVLS